VNDDGAMVWSNLIVATGHNNLAIGKGVEQVAKRFVNGRKLEEGASTASRPWCEPTTPASAARPTRWAWCR